MKVRLKVKTALAATALMFACGCNPFRGNQNTSSPAGLTVYPSVTSVAINQNFPFQVSGGTPPYTFQASGVGWIDSNGVYRPGSTPGQAEILVTDSAGDSGSATVNVVQTVGVNPNARSLVSASWGPAGTAQAPLVRGQVVGVADRTVDSDGDTVHSKFVQTSLKHPVVRMDQMKDGQQVVAERAVIEGQFVVTLHDGYSESDLSAIVGQDGAHISKRLKNSVYVVSMDPHSELVGSSLSPQFLTAREVLKKHLQSIAAVAPRAISRVPAGD